MPCENCFTQFTLFNRKNVCGKCKRHFCGACLKSSRKGGLCETCQIFTSRPLLRDKLKNVKTKDIISYLQSENISTIGCLEKEDLINVVLYHAQNKDVNSTGTRTNAQPHKSTQTSNNEPKGVTLETIRQTCHNFFTNFSENMGDLYTKPRRENNQQVTVEQLHRTLIHQIPPYANSQIENTSGTTCNSNTQIVQEYNDNRSNSQQISSDNDNQFVTASTSNTTTTYVKLPTPRSQLLNDNNDNHSRNNNDNYRDDNCGEEDSIPSPNELGAIGGISYPDDHVRNSMERPLIRDKQNTTIEDNVVVVNDNGDTNLLANSQLPSHSNILRTSDCDDIDIHSYRNNSRMNPTYAFQSKESCSHCIKNKQNILKQIGELRNHVENAHVLDVDIEREMNAFLSSLHKRQHIGPIHIGSDTSSTSSELGFNEMTRFYPSCEQSNEQQSRCVKLDSFESPQQLKYLSVKELKEILMVYRVNFDGCCEKRELLARAEILWNSLKSTPSVHKLPPSDLCKICMDAPIECIILECGHLATCTNCGKVLCECPICRQYIVRVVRFFRA